MSEFEETVCLANKLLERPNADPDDDLAMLSRQFLRQVETVERLKADLVAQYDPHGDLVAANRDAILAKHEEAVRRLRRCLTEGLKDKSGMRFGLEAQCKFAVRVLDALNLFHPMHCESWGGWPEETAEKQSGPT